MVKNLPTNARGIRDIGSIPGPGRSPGEEHGNPLPGESPWTEEPGRLLSIGWQRVEHN